MNRLAGFQNSLWIADGERFMRYVHAALAKPCPSAADIRARHRELMQIARDLPGEAVQGTGVDDPIEVALATRDGVEALGGARIVPVGDLLTDAQRQRIRAEWDALNKGPRADGEPVPFPDSASALLTRAESTRAIRAVKGKVGVIPIYGPVDQRMTSELEKAGGTPLDFVGKALDVLLADQSIGAIVMRFDSPGGSVAGVEELADRIYAARSVKPIYSHADSLAASAALWLASSASMFISTPGGGGATVGSVGVYVMHVDQSAAMEKDGYKVSMISAGKHKTEFSPYSPMSDDARAEAQARVDGIHDQFVTALKRNRGTTLENVRENYGQGRVLTAQQALNVGMIDRILTFNELISKLTGGSGGGQPSRGPSADAMRLRWEAKKRAMEAV